VRIKWAVKWAKGRTGKCSRIAAMKLLWFENEIPEEGW
jgi:hypothetical protein